MRIWPIITTLAVAFLVVACSSPTPPPGTTVVNNFDAKRYLGKWYEIARFDHKFESGLEQVTATYSTMDDKVMVVINRGFNPRPADVAAKCWPGVFHRRPKPGRTESFILWAVLWRL